MDLNSSVNKVYYNTVVLGKSSPLTSTATNFGATGIMFYNKTNSIKNNIININGIAKGTGTVVALRDSVIGIAGTPPSISRLDANNNIYYVTPGPSNYLYAEGYANTPGLLKNGFAVSGITPDPVNNLVNDPTFNSSCSFYKTFMGSVAPSREDSTFNENNLTAITATTFTPTGITYAESGGVTITSPAISTDYADVTRTIPDIGALQFSGTAIDIAAPIINYTPLTNSICTANRVLVAAITDAGAGVDQSGSKPRLYFRKGTDPNQLAATNTSADAGWKWVNPTNASSPDSFVIDYNLLTGPVAVGDSIYYFVVAQDLAIIPNVGTDSAFYPNGYCNSSVVLGPGAFPVSGPIKGYKILASPLTITAVATPGTLCDSSTVILSLGGDATTGATYQWQSSPAGASTFTDISGATTVPYTTGMITASTDYRVVISCGGTPITGSPSSIATVTIDTSAKISTGPSDVTTCAGSPAKFWVTATGTTPSYQWQVSTDNGATFNPATGGVYSTETTDTLHISDVTGLSGYKYRVVVGSTSPCTASINSDTATLTVNSRPTAVISGDASVCADAHPPVTITLTGTAPWNIAYTNGTDTTYVNGNTANPYIFNSSQSTTTTYTMVSLSDANCTAQAGDMSGSATITTSPIPDITNISFTASDICEGSAGSITITSTSLVDGNYRVHFDIDAPNTTNYFDTTVTITGGTGTFYTPVLLNAGNTTITVRDIRFASTNCISDLTLNNTVQFLVKANSTPPSGVTATFVTICNGSSTDLSVVGGSLGNKSPNVVAIGAQWTWYEGGCGNGPSIGTGATITVSPLVTTTYYVRAEGACNNTSCESITITVNDPVVINIQPVNELSACAPSSQIIFVSATNATGYSWEESTDGFSWTPLSNTGVYSTVNTDTLHFSDVSGLNGRMYRVVITGSSPCGSETSNVTNLNVNDMPNVNAGPADTTICSGSSVIFGVTATGTNINYQWQVSTDGGSTWNAATGGVYSTETTDTLRISDVTGLNGNKYRVVVTGSSPCGSDTSGVATLTVNDPPNITSNPVDTTICSGSSATFGVTATGTNISYQWQVSTDGGSAWNAASGGVYSTEATDTLHISNVTGLNGYKYRVVVTGSSSCGPDTSGVATLTVNVAADISSNPADTTVCSGTAVTFGVVASGTGITYQWQVSSDNGNTYGPASGAIYSGSNADTLHISDVTGLNGNKYRVIVTGALPCGADTSTAALLTVKALPVITINPPSATICAGGSVLLTASGATTYTWSPSAGLDTTGGNKVVAHPSGDTKYYVTGDLNGCSSVDSVSVTVSPAGNALAGTPGGSQVCTSSVISKTGTTYSESTNCDLIALIVPSGPDSLRGLVRTCVKIDGTVQSVNFQSYVQRHYDIEPSDNPNTATATVTLYFTQQEFDNYNAARLILFPPLPTGPSDNLGITNLRVTQFHGVGTAPGNYSGPETQIDPDDNKIIWNAPMSRWEVTFDVIGFSGFYITTGAALPLPVTIQYFHGQRSGTSNLLGWKVDCGTSASAKFSIERSTDGRNFTGIGEITTTRYRCNQAFDFNDLSPAKGAVNYYRLKMTDDNGHSVYSTVVAIINKESGFEIVGLLPNLIRTGVAILNVTSARSTKLDIIVTDITGREVMRRSESVIEGSNSYNMNFSNLANGTYQLTAHTNEGISKTVRFVKE